MTNTTDSLTTIDQAMEVNLLPWQSWTFAEAKNVSYTVMDEAGYTVHESTLTDYATFTVEVEADNGYEAWVEEDGEKFYAVLHVDGDEPVTIYSSIH